MHYDLKWLTNKFDSGEALKFIFFWGHTGNSNDEVGKFIFSQWYESSFTVDGIVYPTAEHWMMAWKASVFADKVAFDKILAATKPGQVKELGRTVRGFDEVIWNKRKFEVVKLGNIHKFNQNPKMLKYLLDTGDRILVEASPVDSTWGIGLSADSEMIENPYTWNGENLLGFALMEVRDFLRDFGHFDYTTTSTPPPWKKFPDVNPFDMHWRMGWGESYVDDYGKYIEALSARDYQIHQLSYPAMGDWGGYYEGDWWIK